MAPALRLVGGSGAVRDAGVTASASGVPEHEVDAHGPIRRTSHPMIMGSSIVGLRCVDGVILASDTLASFGSLARFRDVRRLHSVSNNTAIGIGGEYSDMQEILSMLEKLTTSDYCLDDGYKLGPKALYSYLSRVMYNRRNKMDPFWNHVLFAGYDDEAGPMLSMVDIWGGHFESEVIASGYGMHLGLPLLRNAWRDDLTVADGLPIVEGIMKVLFYRDARTTDRIQTAVVTKEGVSISEPKSLDTKWDYKAFIEGARIRDVSTW